MSKRKCLFCGELFSDQKRNFEHVIPAWLVKEADLSKRTAPIDFPSKQFNAAMSRIGGQACEACNSGSSDLESRARGAYVKVRDGIELSLPDGRALLDWLDKVRVGLWLWALDVGKDDHAIEPKFRINERMAHKDRILLATKYAAGAPMRGLAIWGASEYFVWSPSAIGFLINNIVLVSISSDFLVSRHLKNLSIKRSLNDSNYEKFSVDVAVQPGMRIAFFGAPYIIGQCILPADLFGTLGLEMANLSSAHPGWGEGPVLRLNGQLQETDRSLGSVPQFNGNKRAHRILMELQLKKATKFLIDEFLTSDFTNITSLEAQKAIEYQTREYLAASEADIARSKEQYERASGIRLP
jgi:hypothetical protein